MEVFGLFCHGGHLCGLNIAKNLSTSRSFGNSFLTKTFAISHTRVTRNNSDIQPAEKPPYPYNSHLTIISSAITDTPQAN